MYLKNRQRRLLERSLPQPRSLKIRPPNKIRVTKDDFHRPSLQLSGTEEWATDDTAGLEDVAHYLDVERPVSRVVEDYYGLDGGLGEVDGLRGRLECCVVEGGEGAYDGAFSF